MTHAAVILSRAGLRTAVIAVRFLISIVLARVCGLETLALYGLMLGITGTVPAILDAGVFSSIARRTPTHSLADIWPDLAHYYRAIALLYGLADAGLAGASALGVLPIASATAVSAFFVVLCEHLLAEIAILLNNRRRYLASLALPLVAAILFLILLGVLQLTVAGPTTPQSMLAIWALCSGAALGLALQRIRRIAVPGSKEPISTAPCWYMATARRHLPLYASNLVATAAQNLDRFLVAASMGLHAAGVYILYLQLANALFNVTTTAIQQTYRPDILRAVDTPHRLRALMAELRGATLAAFGVGSPAILAALPLIADVAGTPEFLSERLTLALVLAAFAVRAQLAGELMRWYACRRDAALLAFTVANAILIMLGMTFAASREHLPLFPAAAGLAVAVWAFPLTRPPFTTVR